MCLLVQANLTVQGWKRNKNSWLHSRNSFSFVCFYHFSVCYIQHYITPKKQRWKNCSIKSRIISLAWFIHNLKRKLQIRFFPVVRRTDRLPCRLAFFIVLWRRGVQFLSEQNYHPVKMVFSCRNILFSSVKNSFLSPKRRKRGIV